MLPKQAHGTGLLVKELNLGADPSIYLLTQKPQRIGSDRLGYQAQLLAGTCPCAVSILCPGRCSAPASPLWLLQSLLLLKLRNLPLVHSRNLFVACLDSFVPVPALSFGLNCSPPSLVFILLMYL